MPLKAEVPVYGGYALARAEGVVFVKGAIPGEEVEVSYTEKKRGYSVAEAVDILQPSPDRVEPACRYFGVCGGCHLQFVSYQRQARMKEEILLDCLKRIGGMEIELLPGLTGLEFGYRRRAQFKVSKEGAIGFFREATRDVIPIKSCPLMSDEINALLEIIRGFELAGLKEIHITSGKTPTVLLKGLEFDEAVAEKYFSIGFTTVAFGDRSYRGDGYAEFDLLGLRYTVSPWSFLQSNWELNAKTSEILMDALGELKGRRVLDLYAGGGNFSIPLAGHAKSVTCVEENAHSIKDGQRNAELNGLKNIKFIPQSAEKAKIRADALILDPPRPGLAKSVVENIVSGLPETIAYISCNPSTLSRDLKKLGGHYELKSVRMMDFFPNTFHIEAMAMLSRKDGLDAPQPTEEK